MQLQQMQLLFLFLDTCGSSRILHKFSGQSNTKQLFLYLKSGKKYTKNGQKRTFFKVKQAHISAPRSLIIDIYKGATADGNPSNSAHLLPINSPYIAPAPSFPQKDYFCQSVCSALYIHGRFF